MGCGDGDGDPDGDEGLPDNVTYFEHIKPLLDAKCVGCHTEGGIAPFSLETLSLAQAYAGVAHLAIHDGIMPPWLADNDCNSYVGDRSLSDAQIALFDAWLAAGTPAGDPSKEGAPFASNAPSLSRVDLTLSMEQAYTVQRAPDDYRCFVIPWPDQLTSTSFVTGFNAVPGNLGIVHHMIAFLAEPGDRDSYLSLDAQEDGPGYTCFGGTGGPARSWLGSWTPGSTGSDLPEGTGIPIAPGSTIILQVHYNSLSANPEPDLSSIELKLDDQVALPSRVQPFTNPQWLNGDNMLIPAMEEDVVHTFTVDPSPFIAGGKSFTMHTVGFHMHQLGSRGHLKILRAGGGETCLLQIGRWDFNWQGSYQFEEAVVFNPGDSLQLECHWDNSPANQPIVDGDRQIPVDRAWGEGTSDEMCLSGFLMTVNQ